MARWKVYWGESSVENQLEDRTFVYMFVGTCNAIVKEGIDLALAANKPNYGHGHLGQSLLIPTTSDLVAIFKKKLHFPVRDASQTHCNAQNFS